MEGSETDAREPGGQASGAAGSRRVEHAARARRLRMVKHAHERSSWLLPWLSAQTALQWSLKPVWVAFSGYHCTLL
eukprot:SAG22_NODE_2765_length_2228_cov_2.684359_1_plen_75_part_10